MMADALNIIKETIHQILHVNLWNRKIYAKFVPHKLMDEQKQQRLTSYAKTSSKLVKTIPLLDCIFYFLKRKLPTKGRGFRMLKTLGYDDCEIITII
jgi:hypothetical protein